MEKKMNRRGFLKTSLATGALVLAGDMVKGGINLAYGAVKIPEVEKATVTVITDNYYDALKQHYKIAKRYGMGIKPGTDPYKINLHAEHGLSYHVETVLSGNPHSFLFDYGVDFQGVSRNMELLNIDFRAVEALGLSHGHFDHWGTFLEILKSKKEEFRKGTPLYIGEEGFVERFGQMPGGVLSLGRLKRDDVERLGFIKIVEIKDPAPIVPGAYLTGSVERVTEYEKGSPYLLIERGGKLVPDNFIGEYAVVLNLKGKGLIVLVGCAHPGIVNIVKHAQKMTGIDKVHAVMGGFHLTGAKPELIQRTVADIKAVNPDYIVPTHCTGYEAITVFEREMPGQFILNTVGTRYLFTV
jgi:7,8-dihydropterin-6-yl-methyl-4-(beta-D-ribofuranosyl)aminobenzene 5'-phosphate synthase